MIIMSACLFRFCTISNKGNSLVLSKKIMKRLTLLFGSLLLHSLSFSQSAPKPQDFAKLNWLEGNWALTNAKAGHSGNEHWYKISSTELKGTGVNLKGRDTVFVEKFKLVVKGDAIYYVADVSENKQPVDFKLTEISETAFTCENPEHDFPKKIRYEKNGNSLKATISGDGKSIDYYFVKK
jgi:hypothetical protein